MNESENAMYRMVCLPVFTFGSLRMGRPLLTASMPVKVPAPMLYALRMRKSIPNVPRADLRIVHVGPCRGRHCREMPGVMLPPHRR